MSSVQLYISCTCDTRLALLRLIMDVFTPSTTPSLTGLCFCTLMTLLQVRVHSWQENRMLSSLPREVRRPAELNILLTRAHVCRYLSTTVRPPAQNMNGSPVLIRTCICKRNWSSHLASEGSGGEQISLERQKQTWTGSTLSRWWWRTDWTPRSECFGFSYCCSWSSSLKHPVSRPTSALSKSV